MTQDVYVNGRRRTTEEAIQGLAAFAPGDYATVMDARDGLQLWFKAPNGDCCRVTRNGHTIIEEADGTVTVKPSIGVWWDSRPYRWHGYLERGNWREA